VFDLPCWVGGEAVTDRWMLTTLLLAAFGCGSGAGPTPAPCTPLPAGRPTGPSAAAQEWLDGHNLVRSGCGVTLSPAPTPALPLLSWSAAAAAVAQDWASGCAFAHNPDRGADGTPRGENIAASSVGHWQTLGGVVQAWGSEWSAYDHAANTCAAGQQCGHYTQLVWRDTSRVGCARATCTVNSPFGADFPTWEFFVCDYEPPGNYLGQRPY
jgi:hypothetical protein